ncbi:formylglycine-generating enzyme family protein [Maritalea porphyrae]|nr:SUMF1/EgtB/PvdO family nonheme iron enzyme [Maritalea porphyrae]
MEQSQAIEMVDAEIVRIEGGVVAMRDDRVQRQWQTELKPFCMSRFQVTQDIYSAVVGTNPATFDGTRNPIENVSWYEAIAFCNLLSVAAGLDPSYLVGVNKDDVVVNKNANGYRLPSDAEWQFAALGGLAQPRYGEIDQIAWYKANSGAQTHQVGLKSANQYGLFDMLGNVWEWCFDIYDAEVYGTYRVFRGGGWNDPERGCLATNRRRSHPTYGIDDVGFRLARNA